MTFKSKTIVTIIAFSLALPLHAWRIFPILSYGSGSGVLFGGIVNHNMVPPFSPVAFSTMAYMCADGSAFAEPQVLFPAGSGIVRFNVNYSVDHESQFFGWGNDGDDEQYENYDAEIQEIAGSYNFSPMSHVILTGGLLYRHSTAYNRSGYFLWQLSPSEEYRSRWTGGPFIEGDFIIPVLLSGYISAGYGLQFGGETYSDADCAMSVFTPIGTSTTPAFRMKISRHLGTSSTPFCFLPSMGGSSGLRGYSDARFGGNWSLLGNLELRQRIFTVAIDENNEIGLSLVLFGDAGQVADHLDECRWNRFHLDGGIGARFSLPGGGVLRADFALSPEGLGIQMGLGELF